MSMPPSIESGAAGNGLAGEQMRPSGGKKNSRVYVPRVGNRSEQIEARQWNFSLRKAYSGGWVIQEVQAR